MELPTKKEFLSRMTAHINHRQNSDAINLLWKGYLAALMEWGFFEPNDYHELNALLKDVGDDELREIFLGFPGQYE